MIEPLNTVKIPMKSRIVYTPRDQQEEQYIASLEELLKEKRHGDWKLVGETVKISSQLAEKSFLRVYGKNHFKCVEALKKIIENRKALLNTNTKTENHENNPESMSESN